MIILPPDDIDYVELDQYALYEYLEDTGTLQEHEEWAWWIVTDVVSYETATTSNSLK